MTALLLTNQKLWPMLWCLVEKQTYRKTDRQVKNYMPPIYRYGGTKGENASNKYFLLFPKCLLSFHGQFSLFEAYLTCCL